MGAAATIELAEVKKLPQYQIYKKIMEKLLLNLNNLPFHSRATHTYNMEERISAIQKILLISSMSLGLHTQNSVKSTGR